MKLILNYFLLAQTRFDITAKSCLKSLLSVVTLRPMIMWLIVLCYQPTVQLVVVCRRSYNVITVNRRIQIWTSWQSIKNAAIVTAVNTVSVPFHKWEISSKRSKENPDNPNLSSITTLLEPRCLLSRWVLCPSSASRAGQLLYGLLVGSIAGRLLVREFLGWRNEFQAGCFSLKVYN